MRQARAKPQTCVPSSSPRCSFSRQPLSFPPPGQMRKLRLSHTAGNNFRASRPHSGPFRSLRMPDSGRGPDPSSPGRQAWVAVGPSGPVWVPRWQRKVPTCPTLSGRPCATASPGILAHSCGGGVAAPGSVCPGPVPVAKLQALSQQAGQPCHSQQTSGTRKVVAGRKRKLYFP